MDSVVLLHGLAQLRKAQVAQGAGFNLTALHVNHGLHPDAGDWQRHCASTCAALAVPLKIQTLAPGQLQATGGSLEAAARNARYEFFTAQLPAGAVLVLAHHADDQAETILLRMLQGRGLLPMPVTRALGQGVLWRPLLSLSRSVLADYASARGLEWLEDPSNMDEQMDRNYLRQRVLPDLRARWPDLAANLQRTAAAGVAQGAALETVLVRQASLPVAWCASPEGISILRSWLGQFSEYEVTDRALKEFVRQLASSNHRKPQLALSRGRLLRVDGAVCYEPAD